MAFPGATASPEEAAYVVVGAPLDASTSFLPGTRFGPRRIRQFAEPFEDFDRRTGLSFTDLDVADEGDLRPWAPTEAYLEHLTGTLADVATAGAVPLVLGGEHTVSVAGVRATEPATYVCLDAHLDLRDTFEGMALSHACTTSRVLEMVEEVVLLGARSGAEAEWDRADNREVTVVGPDGLGSWQPRLEGPVYLSVDVDVVDPGFAPGTGTLAPFGVEPRTVHRVVRSLAPQVVGFDVVEVNDRDDGQAAALAAALLRAFVYAHADAA